MEGGSSNNSDDPVMAKLIKALEQEIVEEISDQHYRSVWRPCHPLKELPLQKEVPFQEETPVKHADTTTERLRDLLLKSFTLDLTGGD